MNEVLTFILGVMCCLSVIVTVVTVMQQPQRAGVLDLRPGEGWRDVTPASAPRAPAARRSAPVRTLPRADQARLARAYEAQSSRATRRMECARSALHRISKAGENAPATIAGQTLRRLDRASEGYEAQMRFAADRLQLIALGEEPRARRIAQAALAEMA